MKGISCEVLLGTVSNYGPSIWTLKLKFPRFVLSAFSKHRMFSFNSASSRAVKIPKMIEIMEEDYMLPLSFGKQVKGMSNGGSLDTKLEGQIDYNGYSVDFDGQTKEQAWDEIRTTSIAYAKAFDDAGYHQELVGRILEPYQFIEIILTATDFENFFNLRLAGDAQSEIRILAEKMKEAMKSYKLKPSRGGWHLPLISDEEFSSTPIEDLIQISAARAAVLSYYNYKGDKLGIESAKKIANHLINNGGAPHFSPFEHQARELTVDEYSMCLRMEEATTEFFIGSSNVELGIIKKKINSCYYFGNLHSWVSHRFEKEAEYIS